MPSLIPNLVKRVQRLPKPTNAAEALQPLFEAVSNSVHSVYEKFQKNADKRGRITIECSTNRKKLGVVIRVTDNGVGLDDRHYEAFRTTDTDDKIAAGGKGVGRLLWLDAFSKIHVASAYRGAGGAFYKREFDFVLSNDEQISGYSNRKKDRINESYFDVVFSGLRTNEYKTKFPGRKSFVFQHFLSHFLPLFVAGKAPTITLTCDDESKEYPSAADEIIKVREDTGEFDTKDYGMVRLVLMKAEKPASANLKGNHFVHFIAHGRTVKSNRIDSKLGLRLIGDEQLVFHACVFGDYFDRHVNQERTGFTFDDDVLDDVINKECMPKIESFLSAPLKEHKKRQREVLERIVDKYPSVSFGAAEDLQRHVPLGELEDDALFGHLSRERFRRDEKQDEKIGKALAGLRGDSKLGAVIDSIKEASTAVEEQERRSLADYVVRRKVVLDFIEMLVRSISSSKGDSAYQAEDILHSFVCPMRVSTLSSGDIKVEPAASHDLWIIDERLTFSQYFSSDVPFDRIAASYGSKKRPDIMVFDRVHGLRQDGDSKILLIEFKRPGRVTYDDRDNPINQIVDYVRKLQSGSQADAAGRPIRIDEKAIFYCYLIADRRGKLAEWTFPWSETADGRGWLFQPQGGFKGFIELVEWDTLIRDARNRNSAFFDRLGISKSKK